MRTLLGRRRPIPELRASNRQTRSLGERLAVNTVMQGTAADMIKVAMVAIHDGCAPRVAPRGSSCRCTTSCCSRRPRTRWRRCASSSARRCAAPTRSTRRSSSTSGSGTTGTRQGEIHESAPAPRERASPLRWARSHARARLRTPHSHERAAAAARAAMAHRATIRRSAWPPTTRCYRDGYDRSRVGSRRRRHPDPRLRRDDPRHQRGRGRARHRRSGSTRTRSSSTSATSPKASSRSRSSRSAGRSTPPTRCSSGTRSTRSS